MRPKKSCALCGNAVRSEEKVEVKNWDATLVFCGQTCWSKWVDKMVE